MSVPEVVQPLAAGPDLYATILLAGPGGAGKSTVGGLLANRLGVRFVDLDAQFTARYGDISPWLDRHGYAAYAACNVQLLTDLVAPPLQMSVIALSSGFLTYPTDVHPAYPALRRAIVTNRSTVVLLPSFDLDVCVAETVRRQTLRPFSRSAAREEEVIRSRFGVYRRMAVAQFETMRSAETVVEDLLTFATRAGARL